MLQRPSGPPVIKCFFCNERNFGDQLTLPILAALARQLALPLTFVAHSEPATADVIGIGSILTSVPPSYAGFIWTTGCAFAEFSRAFPHATCVAVRGKKTAAASHRPDQLAGDGGLLMPLLFPEPVAVQYQLGVIPHIVDYATMAPAFAAHRDVRLINLREDVASVCQAIKSCAYVISSSLHGLIVADAFGIPNVHVMVEPTRLIGGLHKFEDYYSVFDRPCPTHVTFAPDKTPQVYLDHIRATYSRPGLAALQTRLQRATETMLRTMASRTR